MRIALVGHVCSPLKGSEPGVTWNWADQLSKHHDVTLLSHPQYRDEVDAELQRSPRERLKIVWVTLDKWFDPWDHRVGERGIRWHYSMWQRKALRILQELHESNPFQLVHHVCWATLQQPPPYWKLRLPFVWGPIGGGQTWPKSFLSFATYGRAMERVRRLMVRLAPWNPSIVRTARHADLVLTTNRETTQVLRRTGARRVEYFADYGVKEQWLKPRDRKESLPGELKMLWAGRCEPRKGLPLVLEAMARRPDPKITLTCAGEGPCRKEWETRSRELGLGERVQFLGMVPWTQMSELYCTHDVFLFPSLRDSQGTVVLESMSRGLPLIALDHQGVAELLPDDAGIKVPVTEPRATIDAFADAIRLLASDPVLRARMGAAAAASAATETWDNKVQRMNQWYLEILNADRSL